MDVSIVQKADHVLVCITEKRLDAAIAGKFKDIVRPHVVSHGPKLMFDLTAVEFLDSSGLGAIIALRKILPQGRKMLLRGLNPNVDRVFRLTHMDQFFDILPADEDSAA